MTPKILLFDIENAPGTAYIWQCKNDYIDPRMIKDEWYMLCWAAKWLGEKKIMSASLHEHRSYNPRKPCDKPILDKLWALLNEADIVVAHNAKAFDVRKSNARFIKYGIPPPSPYKVIDTLSEARKNFLFMSNRLNELGKVLGVGEKVRTGGFDLWEDCMRGDRKAWKKMVRYCKNDVLLLEKVYLKLRPYMKHHPNVSIYQEDFICGKCKSKNLEFRGYYYTETKAFHRVKCCDCNGWGRVLFKKNRKFNANV